MYKAGPVDAPGTQAVPQDVLRRVFD